jgi:hypothetical protein
VAYVRTVKTASGATAVQIVWSSRRGSRNIEHIGSAYDDAELEALKAAARQRLAAGHLELDLGPAGPGPSGPLEITSSRMGHLLDALGRAYDAPGFPQATEGDEVFRQLVLARIIEPASKQDSLRALEEAGAPAPSYPPLNRRLPAWAEESWRQGCRRPAPRTPGWARRRWSSTTCPLCTSRPTGATASASPVSPRSGAWSRRSPSACWPGRTGSRSWSPRSKGTGPKEVRPHCPPLPHRPDPRRPAHPHRRRPAPARPPRNPRPHQVTQPPVGSQIHVQATVPATSVSTNPATMIDTRA